VIAWLNGAWLAEQDAHVSIEDAGLLNGDGVFETALLRAGRYFRLAPHLDRLAESARTLDLQPPEATLLQDVARELALRNGLADGTLRITVTRGVRGQGCRFATLRPPDPAWLERARRGWQLITARTRRPSTAAMPAQLKALGRTHALLARADARAAGTDDALLLTDAGLVCEGPSWNVFWRRDHTLFTPTLDLGVLAGVTRAVLLEIGPRLGYRVLETAAPRSALDEADELFATMTSVGLVSVRSLDGRSFPEATPAADRLRAAYWQQVDAELGGPE
jgi:branched-chain amino acid aminotransferase